MDAAVTACAVLAVVYPHMCSIGGDLFALVRRGDGTVVAVNGSGAAPQALDAEELRRGGGMPLSGPHTITVPGVLAGWGSLLELEGRLPLRDILRPAITLADDGVEVAPSLARALSSQRATLAADPGMASVFLSDGRIPAAGGVVRQPRLAATLEAIGIDGIEAFYRGSVGERFVAGLRKLGCRLTEDDLARHETETGAPLAGRYGRWEILTHPPNSQGFVLLEILLILEELRAVPDALGPDAGLIAHVFRIASEDRDRFLADPRRAPVPIEDLFSPRRVRELAGRVREATTLGRGDGRRASPPIGDTVAVVAADGEGRAVSIIQSVFHSFGSGILEPDTGIVCQNRGACFTLDPASPNLLEGGKRPAHTLMPVMVATDGHVRIVAGTMGGRAQPQIHAHILGRLFGGEPDLQRALEAPRWVVGTLEAGGPTDVVFAERAALERCGHALRATGLQVAELGDLDEEVGHAQYILIGEDGELEAATDPRADGEAASR